MEHVSCLILYGYMSYLRQSWSTFTHWGQALIYYWLGLSTHWGLNTHLQQLAFILFFLHYCFSIFLQVFRLACMVHCLALCPTCTRCGILWIGRFTPRLWTIVPLFSNPQNNCPQSVHSLHFTLPLLQISFDIIRLLVMLCWLEKIVEEERKRYFSNVVLINRSGSVGLKMNF